MWHTNLLLLFFMTTPHEVWNPIPNLHIDAELERNAFA